MNKTTEIIFILDRSGSMFSLTKDTIGGFNTFIKEQKKQEGEARLTTVLFDHEYKLLHDGLDISKVPELTEKDYIPRGSTALLDAIGKTVANVNSRLIKKEEMPQVIFVITTDGKENASEEYQKSDVRTMIENMQKNHKWQFIFLGANMDAVSEAQDLGIGRQFASTYTADAIGTDSLYMSMTKSVANYRSKGVIDENWKNEIK